MSDPQDLSLFVRHPSDGCGMDLVVDGVTGRLHRTIEKGLRRQDGVRGARVNLASKRVTVEWDDGALERPDILEQLEALGYPAYPFGLHCRQRRNGLREAAPPLPRGRCLRRDERDVSLGLAVGGRGSDPNPATRDLFHWLSALVALPCAAYAGQPFFESATKALRARRSTWTCRSRSASRSRSACRSSRRSPTSGTPISTAR